MRACVRACVRTCVYVCVVCMQVYVRVVVGACVCVYAIEHNHAVVGPGVSVRHGPVGRDPPTERGEATSHMHAHRQLLHDATGEE